MRFWGLVPWTARARGSVTLAIAADRIRNFLCAFHVCGLTDDDRPAFEDNVPR